MGDWRRARFSEGLALLPERSAERAAALVELAAAWNLLQREELSSLLSDGADLAAELGARAVELRARLLLLGAMPEDAPDYMDERETILQTNAALAELEAMDAPRAVATALARPRRVRVVAWPRRQRGSSPCAGRSPSREMPTRTRCGRSQRSSLRWSPRRCPSRTASSSSAS
jgi:hypothetical protein